MDTESFAPGQDTGQTRTRPRVADFVALIKPGIIRLLLVLTFCTMLVAARGLPDLWLTLWTLLGMGMISGSANAMNMVL